MSKNAPEWALNEGSGESLPLRILRTKPNEYDFILVFFMDIHH
jgi:hypothetical protein